LAVSLSLHGYNIFQFRRAVVVTLALSITGAIVGSGLGVLAMSFLGLFREGLGGLLNASVLFPVGAMFGALAGASLGPAAGWILLRRVPLGRAIAHTAAGTAIGVIAGYGLGPVLHLGLLWPIALGVLGFLAAAVRLRLATPPRATEQIAPSA
jgi:hypothetical protein